MVRLRVIGRAADENLPPLTLPSPPLFRCAGGGEGVLVSATRLTKHPLLIAAVVVGTVVGSAVRGLAEEEHIWLRPKGQRLTGFPQGPYADLPDGSVLAVDSRVAQISKDDPDEAWPKAVKVVALGSSTTAPRGSVKHVYCDRLDSKLRDGGLPVEMINSGIGGSTTEHSRGRFDSDVLDHDPALVVIMLGGNDAAIDVWKNPPAKTPRVAKERYAENLCSFVKTLKARNVKVILMTPPPFRWTAKLEQLYGKPPYDVNDPWGFSAKLAEYGEVVRAVASEEAVPLVDVFKAFRDYDTIDGQSVDDLLLDGMHPNDKGHAIITELLAPVIEKACKTGEGPAGAKERVADQPLSVNQGLTEIMRNAPVLKRPGYTIPLIDISKQNDRQIIVDKEEGQYLGHVTTVLLENNKTMLAAYPKSHGGGSIVLKRSTDGGLTWSDRLSVPENWATSKEVPTIYRVVDPKGVKRLILFSGLYPIRLSVSEDEGANWTPLAPIGDFGGVVAMASVERLKDGRYMAFFHDDGRFLTKDGLKTTPKATNLRRCIVYATVSNDGGLTWGKPRAIATHPTAYLCEPGAVRSPDGKQLALLLRENSRRHNSFAIFSSDEGHTWSQPVQLAGALTGDRHTCRYAPDDRLVVVFRDTCRQTPTSGDFVAWVGTYDDILNGREGQYRVRLMENHMGLKQRSRFDCGYPGLEVLPDGTLVATTYGTWIEGQQPFIVSIRFKLDEIDRLALHSFSPTKNQ